MGTKIVVIGVGTQGSMIAFRNAVYGKEVVGYSRSEASRQQCRARVERFLQHYMETGRLTPAQADAARGQIT